MIEQVSDTEQIVQSLNRAIDELSQQLQSRQALLEQANSDTMQSERTSEQAQARHESLQAELTQAEHDLALASVTLRALTGTSEQQRAEKAATMFERRVTALQSQFEQSHQELAECEQERAQAQSAQEQAEQEHNPPVTALHEQIDVLHAELTRAQEAQGQELYKALVQEIEQAEQVFTEQRREALVAEYHLKALKDEASARLAAHPELARQIQDAYKAPAKELTDSTIRILTSWLDLLHALRYDGQNIESTIDRKPFLHLLSLSESDMRALLNGVSNGRQIDRAALYDSRTKAVSDLIEQQRKKIAQNQRGFY